MNQQTGQQIHRAVHSARRRLRFHQFLVALAGVLVAALVLAVGILAAGQFVAIDGRALAALIAVFALGAVVYLVARTLRGTGAFETACAIDRRADIADRLASASEFLGLESPGPLVGAQIADADRVAGTVQIAPLFPFDSRAFARRLLWAALCVPFVYAVVAFDLTALLPEKQAQTPAEVAEEFAEQAPDVPAPELEEVGLSDEVLSLIRPAEEMIQRWKERLRRIESEREADPEMPEPEEKDLDLSGKLPEVAKSTPTFRDRATRNVTPDMNAQQVRLSDLKGLVDREADGEYADAFSYLDKRLFGENGEKLADVQEFAEQMVKDNETRKRAGQDMTSTSDRYMQSNMENDKNAAFEQQVKGAQMQSMSEFMSEYAAHLMRMTGKMEEIIEQAQKLEDKPLKDIYKERYKLVDTGQRFTRPMSELTQKDLEEGTLRKLSPEEAEGSAAGYGFGTPEGQFKVPKVEKSGTEYMELDSQFGEGQSLAILEDLAAGDSSAYEALFTHYAMSAEDILNAEDIPIVIKNYVREYFLAISPANVDED